MKPAYIATWRAHTSAALAERGRKADLARHLAQLYGGAERVWQKNIQAALKTQVPSGELLLAIDHWLAGH